MIFNDAIYKLCLLNPMERLKSNIFDGKFKKYRNLYKNI